MPRNSSGIYTLPQSPFVAGTAILSSAVNSNFSDIASALTGSLATNGSSAMTGQFKSADGSLAAPGISFSSALGCGFYLVDTNQIGYSANGALSVTFNSDGTITFIKGVTFSASVSFTSATFPSAVTFGATVTFSGPIIASNSLTVAGTATFNGTVTFNGDVVYSGNAVAANCRLALSGGNLVLSRYNGNSININGTNQSIPGVGVSLAAAGVSASTFYYIYVYMNSGTMTLEYSTTGYTINSTTGLPQKSGDATRTLVGAAFTTAGSAWADADGTRYVISYFNRRRKSSITTFTTDRNTINCFNTYGEVNSEIRNGFISWNDEVIDISLDASYQYSAASQYIISGIGIDTASSLSIASLLYTNSAEFGQVSTRYITSGLTENTSHYATFIANANSIAYTIYGGSITGAVNGSRGSGSRIQLTIMG